MRNRLAALGTGLVLLAGGSAYAQDTVAVEVNTKDGSSLFDYAFAVHRVAGDVVDNGNAAVAVASCEECQTVAVAIQVVLVFGDPSVLTPENLALATNVECTFCRTFAAAYQYVIGTDGPVHFSAEGNRRLAALRLRLQALAKSGATLAEVEAEVEAIVAELRDVLATELVPAGPPSAPPPPPSSSPAEPSPSGSPPAPAEPSGAESPSPSGSPS